MTVAILYRWRVEPAKERQFEAAWREGTKLIHEKCGSYGARLHKGKDGLYWSYALWPDEQTRRKCFRESGVTDAASFKRMQDAVIEYFDEIALDVCVDELEAPPEGKK
ncbi:MAG: antibiotic biosynthesis monooxygenase [Alphaproteobacteria bacterium]|nr:antibiotic biosynthesis monooxygenase [Alphaproteobacteria bacterium]